MKPQINNSNAKNKVAEQIFTPQYGVRLDEGLFKRVFDNNMRYLKSLSVESVLYWFRRRIGEDAPGTPYTNSHFEDNLKGQTAFLMLMGAGNSLRWVRDEELSAIIAEIVDEIYRCRDKDGYCMAVEEEYFTTWEYPHYVRIWMTYGLYAAYLAGNERAGELLADWQDWFTACGDLPVLKHTNLAFQGVVCDPYIYNTPFGKYRDIENTIKYYEEPWRLAQYISREREAVYTRRQPGYEPHPHGTEIEAFEGYLDLYKATGNHYYMRALKEFYRFYKEDWQHIGGGIVMCEFETSKPGCAWLSPPRSYNELCCSAFWMWLNQRLHRLYPMEENYVSEIERTLYNIAIANQDEDEGIRYFAWMQGEHSKGGIVHCCCGVGTRIFGSLPEYLYSINNDEIYVDIYAASTIEWQREEGIVTVQTITDMPYSDKVRIKVSCLKQQKFAVNLRIPSWVDGNVSVKLYSITDGASDYISCAPGEYAKFDGIWQEAELEFTLPFKWKQTQYSGVEKIDGFERYGLEYGPLLMAAKYVGVDEVTDKESYLELFKLDNDPKEYGKWLIPAGKPLSFGIEGNADVSYKPYFELAAGDWFACYPLWKS